MGLEINEAIVAWLSLLLRRLGPILAVPPAVMVEAHLRRHTWDHRMRGE